MISLLLVKEFDKIGQYLMRTVSPFLTLSVSIIVYFCDFLVKEVCLSVAAAELTGVSNIPSSARLLIGQRAGSWLSTLKDVKDRVQSATPAIPKLLPSAVLEQTVTSATSKQNTSNNAPTKCSSREISMENHDCEYLQPVDVESSQMSTFHCTCDDASCRLATSESTELSSELSINSHVDDLTVCRDQNSVTSAKVDDNQSYILGKQDSQLTAENNIDVLPTVSLAQMSLSSSEQNMPSNEQDSQHCTEMSSQSVVTSAPREIRTFSANISDSPEIIFSSFRKRKKSVKHGICLFISHYICYISMA